jgi:sugar lactone lactonase YvrE
MLLLVSGCGGSSGAATTLTAITISPNQPTLPAGTSQQFNATGFYSDGSSNDLTSSVTWSLQGLSDPSVATISATGLVTDTKAAGATISNGTTTITAGKATIIASINGISGNTNLTVIPTGIAYSITSWSTIGTPSGVALDSFGNVYVADSTNNVVREYNLAGTQTTSWTTTGEPNGVAVDSSGNVYVIDISNNLLRKYNSSGTPSTSWPIASGTGVTSTTGSPSGVAVDSSGNVYVTDSLNKMVRVYGSISGAQIASWSTTGIPSGVAVDSSGFVYVTDITNSLLRKYSSDGSGTQITSWSTTGYAYGVAVDAANNVYVTDYLKGVLRKYSPAGIEFPDPIATGGEPYGVVIDTFNNEYVTDITNNLVRKYAQ